ncbi:cytochrome P450 12b1, mitochondrial-like isoform X1 [Ctenocephalides felis]|uniref:cytochrome P450 12b1, mitochondrial-like isoform X1 n=1 Tax=Ctenocephalides felis TaxID=7515 RepID=UPI000E6E1057|nr:cytochrome P450 12b1, mitochondrial-like isoform X1 [Ctenocephalides felis]
MFPSSRSIVVLSNKASREFLKQKLIQNVIVNKYSTNIAEQKLTQAVSVKDALPYNKIPGPSTLPIIGVAHHFAPGGKYKGLDLAQLTEKLYEEYGDIVAIRGLPGKPDMVFLYNFDHMEKVYRTEGPWPDRPAFESREYYLREKRPEVFKSVYGLIHSQGEEWQKIRSVVNQPMMQHKITRQYVGWIEEIANDFIARMKTRLDKEGNVPEDFQMEMNKWSLESIARIAVDTRLGCFNPDAREHADGEKLINALQKFFVLGYEIEILPSFWKYIKTPKFNELMQVYDDITEVALKYISQAMKRLETNPSSDEENLSVLEKLLKKDPQVAIIMALDMFFAGVDTTSSSTITTLYNLAKNQDKQDILREHLGKVFPKGSPITAEGLNNIPYLKACFKESHRIKPVAQGVGRLAVQDIVLGKYIIPKGKALFLLHDFSSRVKNQFPDWNKFLPERWLRTETEGVPSAKCAHKFAYMPFGFGPRMCVGRRFAELEMEVLVSRLITDYKVHWTGAEMQYKNTMIQNPTGPMNFKFTPV